MPPAPPFLVNHSREPIDVLYRDEHLILVRKPHSLLSVPGRDPRNHDSLVTRLQAGFPGALIVHRLDLDTSGVMVLALDPDTHAALSRLFQQRKVSKRYEAIVAGAPTEAAGEIDLPLRCDWERRPLQIVDREQGRPALTHYRVLSQQGDSARVELRPVTGRSHQLRVHLAALGHPILGDRFYAPPALQDAADRLLLHACHLAFEHPVTGTPLAVDSPAPF